MTQLPLPKAVIFDLDGTLVDSAGDIAMALNEAVAPRAGGGAFTIDDVKQMIGGGSMMLIRKALASRDATLDEAAWQATLAEFMSAYRAVSAQGRGLYPGAVELLTHLRRLGVKTAICTNKPAGVTTIAVQALRLDGLVDFVIGATEDVPKKPAPDMLIACCRALGVDAAHAVMVGDSGADRGAAEAAGMPCVLVDFGYAKGPVADLRPDVIVSHLADIGVVFSKPLAR